MRMIDTHCHPQHFLSPAGASEPSDEAIKSFLDGCFAEIDSILMVAITLDDFRLLQRAASMDERAHMSIGVHPCYAHEKPFALQWPLLHEYAAHPLVKALGETGLDGYHSQDYHKEQEEFFCAHLECAATVEKPIIVHTRAAAKRTLEILKAYPYVRGVIHCFTEDADFARTALDLGWMISFSGIVTFPKAKELAEVAKFVPKDSLLIETDAPYLAPVPYRGKTNHPSYVRYVGQHLAALLDWDEADFITIMHRNYQKFLHINKR